MNQSTGNSDHIDNEVVVFHQRIRFTLLDKKEVVYSFYNFLEEPNNIKIRLLDREAAIKAFLKYQNNNQQSLNDTDEKAQVHIIKKWIEAERRAEYLDWNGTNNISNKTCKWEKVVITQIDFILKNRDLRCAEYRVQSNFEKKIKPIERVWRDCSQANPSRHILGVLQR